jgi:branched-chain amino acid transport system substrate-binding protein
MMYLIPTNVPDLKLLLEKMNEFGLAKGRIPMMANGAPMGTPELLKNVGKDLVEGLMFSVANWPAKGQEQLIERFKKATGEPWMTQDSLCSYGDMWIFKEALEIAGKADRKAVAEALRKMDFKDGKGPAAFYPGGRVKFDEAGRRVDAALVIAQWQNAVPVTVFPEASALSKPNFPAK